MLLQVGNRDTADRYNWILYSKYAQELQRVLYYLGMEKKEKEKGVVVVAEEASSSSPLLFLFWKGMENTI